MYSDLLLSKLFALLEIVIYELFGMELLEAFCVGARALYG